MSRAITYSPAGDAAIDGMLMGAKWATTSLTFSFPARPSLYELNYGGELAHNFGALTAQEQQAVRAVLASYAAVAPLTFTEITDTATQHADLRFAKSDLSSTAWAYYPSAHPQGGDTWYNNSSRWYDNPVKGNYDWLTSLHEVGHALGLKHPHEVYGAFAALPGERDSLESTVMSYRSFIGAPTGEGWTNGPWDYPQTPMRDDIRALQELYGANYATQSGDTHYSWSPTSGEMRINGVGQGAPGANRIFLTVWDGGGIDSYDFSAYASSVEVDLRPGAWTTTSAAQRADLDPYGSEARVAAGTIATAWLHDEDARSLIENALGGAGDDRLTGNVAANALSGGDGDDHLSGLEGADTLNGEDGDDQLKGGTGDDSLDGGTGDDFMLGEAGSDNLFGDEGNDYGYGGEHADVLLGGPGHDLLLGEAGGDGMDGAGGQDWLFGGKGPDLIFGGADVDLIWGEEGWDDLFGEGGVDHILGGAGADSFWVTSGSWVDVIHDFDRFEGDRLVLVGSGYATPSQALAQAVQIGTTLVIPLAGGAAFIHLHHRTLADITAADIALI